MKAGKLQVPRFQRDSVWPLNTTCELLGSMLISINRPW
jgi:hypothetical protein